MRALLTALLLGSAAAGLLAVAAVAGIGVAVDAVGGRGGSIAIGPLLVAAWERSGSGSATTFGPGLPVVALAGGLVNAAAAALLRARRSA